MDAEVTLFLCGDVMLGRGVDQILACPGNPELREDYLRDARRYVSMAEELNGPIPKPVDAGWPWGDALDILGERRPDARLINLETAITRCDAFEPGKPVHYRMNPANIACLTAAKPDVCALANNHMLDFGPAGLVETLEALEAAGVRGVGGGRDGGAARAPAIIPLADGRRVIVVSCGTPSSGVPRGWSAGDHPGVNLVPALSAPAADAICSVVSSVKKDGDLAVVSIHWGSNWGYHVDDEQRRFAHRLVDRGIDVVHGHSSHHARPIEIYRDRLVLYGCGDFIDDYEGIPGYEGFRDDLRVMYFPSLQARSGALRGLRMVVLQARRMRLHRASQGDVAWLAGVLDQVSWPFATRVDLAPDGTLTARPA